MRIVQLANLVTPTSGGLRVVLEELGRGYLDAGHERVVVTPGERADEQQDVDGTLRVTLPGVPLPASGGYRLLVDRRAVARLLRSLRPDALEVSDRFTLDWTVPWARQRGIAATLVVHERLGHALRTWSRSRSVAERAAAMADRRLARQVGTVVVPSRFAAGAFPDAKTAVVPWGVDLTIFHPRHARPEPSAGVARLVMVGRLSREKHPELAIDAVRELARQGFPCHLDVLGDGPRREALTHAAQGLPIRFHGQLPRAEVARYLASAEVALAPCPAETFGLAALEALASGTPIIVPSRGALPELLGLPQGRSAVTAAGAAAAPQRFAFAFAIRRLLDLDAGRRREAARRRALAYPWQRAQDALLTLHQQSRRLAPAA